MLDFYARGCQRAVCQVYVAEATQTFELMSNPRGMLELQNLPGIQEAAAAAGPMVQAICISE